jgi:hypothetical protein
MQPTDWHPLDGAEETKTVPELSLLPVRIKSGPSEVTAL